MTCLLAGTYNITILTSDKVSKNVDALHDTTQQVHQGVGALQMKENMNRITKWLSAPDPSINHNEASKRHHDGTGLWFVHGGAFKEWKKQTRSFLWLHGIPGCGKTVLSSTIIEHLKQELTSQPLLYFYFDFNDGNKQSLDDLLRSLVDQICQARPDSQQSLERSWASHGEGSQQPSTDSLQSLLKSMLRGVGRVTILLDALDESKPRDELLAWLKSLFESTQIVCRLLITARREVDIESALQCWTHDEDRIPIQQDEVNKDISAYVKDKLRNGDELRRWRTRPDLQDEIEVKLTKQAGGM